MGIGALLFSLNCFAGIDPELIGVWETQYTPGRVVEFKQDGTTITWKREVVKTYLQVSAKLTFLSREKIHTQSNKTFSPVGENKPFTYKVVNRDGHRATKNTSQLKKLLNSAQAGFLKRETDSSDQRDVN